MEGPIHLPQVASASLRFPGTQVLWSEMNFLEHEQILSWCLPGSDEPNPASQPSPARSISSLVTLPLHLSGPTHPLVIC